jgi:hypothetical protein
MRQKIYDAICIILALAVLLTLWVAMYRLKAFS